MHNHTMQTHATLLGCPCLAGAAGTEQAVRLYLDGNRLPVVGASEKTAHLCLDDELPQFYTFKHPHHLYTICGPSESHVA